MTRKTTLKTVYAAFFLCLALLLPLLTGQLKSLGKMLNLMHVAIFLCGMVCGGYYGALIGFTAPLLRSVTFGMPVLFPNAVVMAFELAVYGFLSGVLYKLLYNVKGGIYISLATAMFIGRLVWGFVTLIVWSFMGDAFTFALFIKGAFVDSFVGIILHLVLVPIVVMILKRAGLLLLKD